MCSSYYAEFIGSVKTPNLAGFADQEVLNPKVWLDGDRPPLKVAVKFYKAKLKFHKLQTYLINITALIIE